MKFLMLLKIMFCLFLREIASQLRTNFIVKRFDICFTDSPVKFHGNFTNENNNQYFDFDLMTPIPVDENIGLVCQIDSAINEKIFVPLFTMREKRFCEAANKYLGEFWYDLERAAQITPGVCPIREGHYRLHHHVAHFEKITLQTFPFGTLRVKMEAIEKMRNKTVFCILLHVENVPN